MLITRRTLVLLLLNALLLVGATFAPILLSLSLLYMAVVVGMILLDRRLTPSAGDFELSRINEPRLSLGAENVVIVRLTNRGNRRVHRRGDQQ